MRDATRWAAAVLAAILLSGPASAQNAVGADPKEAAAAMRAGDYQHAADLYRRIVEANPEAGMAWYQLGFALHSLGKYEQAIEADTQAARLAPVKAAALYNLACAQAMLGRADEAFAALDQAIDAGFDNLSTITEDKELESLRAAARWAGVLERVRAAAAMVPARQFDFWVGSWDVFNPQGAKVGTNIISARQNGHIIHESWTNMQGVTGESINFYDPARRKWRQVWIDQGGGVVEYEGAFEDGAMRMTGKNIDGAGKEVLSRVAFTPLPDGRVRQFIEQSTDGGATWTVYFDGHYQRRAAETPGG